MLELENKMKIPSDFLHPLFFSKEDELLKLEIKTNIKETIKSTPFIFDIAFVAGKTELLQPWEDQSRYLPLLLELWDVEKKELSTLFKMRDRKNSKKPMIQSLSYYVQFLYWSNGQAVPGLQNWKSSISCIKNKPINVVERLEFIFVKPDQYHSFSQLSQLFEESIKHYHKEKALTQKN